MQSGYQILTAEKPRDQLDVPLGAGVDDHVAIVARFEIRLQAHEQFDAPQHAQQIGAKQPEIDHQQIVAERLAVLLDHPRHQAG